MQQPRVENPGWAAFDRKHRKKECDGPEENVDAFPSLSNLHSSLATKSLISNNFKTMKPFTFVIQRNLELPPLETGFKIGAKTDNVCQKYADHQVTAKTQGVSSMKLLMDVHTWADQQLIEDVLSAVDDDIDQASVLLKGMASTDSKTEAEASFSDPITLITKDKCEEESNCIQKDSLLSDNVHKVSISNKLFCIPAEPEWEEDDVYLNHRKDALKMVRAASQHVRAASNAYSRGDHVSARHLSVKAQEEWVAANKLNHKAAEEILLARNSQDDRWKLDLHGLHASEAVKALTQHLHVLESEIRNHHASPTPNPSLQRQSVSQRQSVLQVITGIGKHSRGQASLPLAIKNFLTENRYHFNEARPGVFAVHPKFRYK
ncbi:uncharacterized protein LOC122024421 [Zingiber officinale]|nr:uncharacterized protein LOC122024421 [Zingiber officinale]XP_042438979.1 uncharacterized protein LOC122024421 [Zingiber officinale]